MSNTTTNILALVALFFLWGLAGHFDEVDDAALQSSAASQSIAAMQSQEQAPVVRLVCVAAGRDVQALPSTARDPAQPRLISFSVPTDGEVFDGTRVLRCFVDND